MTPTPTPICGNGTAEGLEECDDGNTTSGDGCSAQCQLEAGGNVCAGFPTSNATTLDAVLVASGYSRPVGLFAAPLDPNRLFVVDAHGQIYIIKAGVKVATAFLDIGTNVSCCGEQGLLGLAFHPNFENNGRFFVNYTNTAGDTVIARYQVSANNADLADATSEKILLTITQPFSNHNGGNIVFGSDGYLYVGMGDGGDAGDPLENGQSDNTLLGKMLRIDVNVEATPYHAVPATNPHANLGDPLGLIWAKGLRNPWRFSFDRLTHDLYIADVGQSAREEVDVQPASSAGGENYGWDVFEGNSCYDPQPLFMSCPNPPTGFTFPVTQYTHSDGCSISGGFVYRGCAMPNIRGTYFYGDYCSAFVRSFVYSGGAATNPKDWTTDLGSVFANISSFGEDVRGELYVVDIGSGSIYKIVPGS